MDPLRDGHAMLLPHIERPRRQPTLWVMRPSVTLRTLVDLDESFEFWVHRPIPIPMPGPRTRRSFRRFSR